MLGGAGIALTSAAYLYYTIWVLLTPFVDSDVLWFHSLFPDRWWAVAVPTALFVLGLTSVVTFVGLVSLGTGARAVIDATAQR